MNKLRLTVNTLAIAIFTLAFASLAQAQATRTWVSGVGDDVNPCSRTAPCKTFAGAISKTATGGEIDALDPGGFGTVTINKALTIDGSGTFASILNSGTSGVIVNAAATSIVTLRGLSIQGARQSPSPGTNGVRFLAGKGLNIIDCIIQNQSTAGVDVALGATGSFVYIRNTVIKNCGGDGLVATTGVGTVKIAVERSAFTENGTGVHAKANSIVSIDASNVSNSGATGVLADGALSTATVNISNSSITNNVGAGIQSQTNFSVVRLNNCDVLQNQGNGVFTTATGTVESYGNNRFAGNADGTVCTGCGGVLTH